MPAKTPSRPRKNVRPPPPSLVEKSRRPWESWAPWIIVILVGLSFGRVVGNGINPVDDRATIFLNPLMNTADHPPAICSMRGAGWYWKHSDLALYIPVTYTLWFILAKLTWVSTPDQDGFHLDPHIFHAASLLLHIGNTLLVYWLLRRLLKSRKVQTFWPALAGALIYGLHPLQVESVAWASGMKDLLYCGFSLMALLAYLYAVEPVSSETKHGLSSERWFIYACGIVAMVLGMLCKPTAMVVPLIAFILDWSILRRPLKKVIVYTVPYAIVAVPLMIVAKIVQPGMAVPEPPMWERPIIAGASLAFYLSKLLVPVHLAFDYGLRPNEMVYKPQFWWMATIPLIVLGFLLILWRRLPWLLVGAFVTAAALLPVSGLSTFHYQFFSTVADHYMILAMLGPAIAVAGLLSHRAIQPHVPSVAAAVAIAVIFGAMSFHQLRFWKTPADSTFRTLAITPDSALGHNALAGTQQAQGDVAGAEANYWATTSNPMFFAGMENLALMEANVGNPGKGIAAVHRLWIINNRFPPQVRADERDILIQMAKAAITHGHRSNVPYYLLEMLRMWYAKEFESWLGGPLVKYLPAPQAVPIRAYSDR